MTDTEMMMLVVLVVLAIVVISQRAKQKPQAIEQPPDFDPERMAEYAYADGVLVLSVPQNHPARSLWNCNSDRAISWLCRFQRLLGVIECRCCWR